MADPATDRNALESPNGNISAMPGKRLLFFALRAALSLIVIALLLTRMDRSALLRILSRERPEYFAAAVLLYIGGQAAAACRWWLLARIVALKGELREFVAYYFIGVFTNLFVPGLIGGDAARSIYLGRSKGRIVAATASVIADRLVGLVALTWFAAVCILIVGRNNLPAGVAQPILLALGLSAAGYVSAPAIARLVDRLPGRLKGPAQTLEPYFRRRTALILPLAISVGLHASQVLAQFILARGIKVDASFKVFLLCVPIANAIASLPVTLNGLGVREGLYVLLFTKMGVDKTDAIAMGLLWFACSIVGSLFGAPAFVFTPAPSKGDDNDRVRL